MWIKTQKFEKSNWDWSLLKHIGLVVHTFGNFTYSYTWKRHIFEKISQSNLQIPSDILFLSSLLKPVCDMEIFSPYKKLQRKLGFVFHKYIPYFLVRISSFFQRSLLVLFPSMSHSFYPFDFGSSMIMHYHISGG